MEKITKQAETLYQTCKSLCESINSFKKDGWIVLDEEDQVLKGKFVFSNWCIKKGIVFQWSETMSSCWLEYGECSVHGKDTFYQECKACYNDLTKYKLINPKDAKSITSL